PGAVGEEVLHHLLVEGFHLLYAVFVVALARRGQIGRFEQEVRDFRQGRGHDHRLLALVLLDEPGHGAQTVVRPDGGGIELHDDHGSRLCLSAGPRAPPPPVLVRARPGRRTPRGSPPCPRSGPNAPACPPSRSWPSPCARSRAGACRRRPPPTRSAGSPRPPLRPRPRP